MFFNTWMPVAAAAVLLFTSNVQAGGSTAASHRPTVTLDSGVVEGTLNIKNTVATYRGIPYAAPPVGPLRFKNPSPPKSWTGTRAAYYDGAGCPQACKLPAAACPPVQDESCLFLNVFAPVTSAKQTTTELLPVMFWIHGGDFYQGYGGGILYDGTSLADHENVIVVALNYRLGALGFLYSGNDNGQFTGNYGILDQQAALGWVQRNARAFGGDPAQVTIFGQSAGGDSVGTLLTMPSSKGLFSKAIMQSFPVGLPFRTSEKFPSFTKVVARDSGCRDSPYEACMMQLTWKEILAGAVQAESNIVANIDSFLNLFQPFTPTVGTPDLALQPFQSFEQGKVLDVPLVMGSVRQEGMIFMYEAFKKNLIRTEEDGLLAVIYGLQNVEKILKEYPRNRSSGSLDGKDMKNHTAPIVTDSLFKCPIRKVLLTLSAMEKNGTRQSKGYNYHFDHVLSFGSSFWLPTSPVCVRRKRRGYFERVR